MCLIDFCHGSAGQEASRLDDRGRVADLAQLGEDVRADEHRLVQVGRQYVDQAPQLDPRPGVQPGGRFVEHQHRGIVDQRSPQRQPLRHPFGEGLDRFVRQLPQLGENQDALDGVSPDVPRKSVGPREEVDVFHDIHVRVLAETVRHEAHNAAHLVRIIDDRIAINECLSGRRNIERSQDPHRGRLARAVGADEPHHLARIRP